MDYLYLGLLNTLHDAAAIVMGSVVFWVIGPWVFKKIGEWFTIGASIGGLKVLQKINEVKVTKGEKDEKENEKVRK